jgi:DeoR/GlpR family transcriptional regulator of sugar metabolism
MKHSALRILCLILLTLRLNSRHDGWRMAPIRPLRDFNGGSRVPVLARRRQDLILDEIRRVGAVRVSELTQLLGVSDMTVRRDLDVLAGAGLVEKVHGGATATVEGRASSGPGLSAEEPGFEVKSHQQLAEKRAIAAAAAQLIKPGSAIGITAGTTTWQLVHHVSNIADLTVVTNSVPVADLLHRSGRRDLSVVLTGGTRTPSDALVGPVAANVLRTLHVDQLFMGVHGITERSGFSTPNLMEAETNRAFVESAERLIVLADSTKWGVHGLSMIASIAAADTVISDVGLPHDAREMIERVASLRLVGS